MKFFVKLIFHIAFFKDRTTLKFFMNFFPEFWRHFGLNPAMMAAAAASTSGGSGLPGMPGVVPSPGNGNNGGSGSNHGGNLFSIIV